MKIDKVLKYIWDDGKMEMLSQVEYNKQLCDCSRSHFPHGGLSCLWCFQSVHQENVIVILELNPDTGRLDSACATRYLWYLLDCSGIR